MVNEVQLRELIVEQILTVRQHQIDVYEHGGDADKFDKGNSQNDWVAYIAKYLGRATNCARDCEAGVARGNEFDENLVKIAAHVMAALEARAKGYC